MKRILSILALSATLIVGGASGAIATKPSPEHKVTICHALPVSASHAYNRITVDVASSGYVKGGHHEPGGSIGDKHADGGDIIPPYTYRSFSYPGQNWNAEGRAIYKNGCKAPPPPPTYDVSASILLCGDPRAIVTLVNDSNVPRTFRIRYVKAQDGTRNVLNKTVKADSERTLFPRWVKGHTMVKVWGERGELLDKAWVGRKNISGPCPK